MILSIGCTTILILSLELNSLIYSNGKNIKTKNRQGVSEWHGIFRDITFTAIAAVMEYFKFSGHIFLIIFVCVTLIGQEL